MIYVNKSSRAFSSLFFKITFFYGLLLSTPAYARDLFIGKGVDFFQILVYNKNEVAAVLLLWLCGNSILAYKRIFCNLYFFYIFRQCARRDVARAFFVHISRTPRRRCGADAADGCLFFSFFVRGKQARQ